MSKGHQTVGLRFEDPKAVPYSKNPIAYRDGVCLSLIGIIGPQVYRGGSPLSTILPNVVPCSDKPFADWLIAPQVYRGGAERRIVLQQGDPMKTAQPRVPDKEHKQIKAEAKRRGVHLPTFYAEILREGLRAIKERK